MSKKQLLLITFISLVTVAIIFTSLQRESSQDDIRTEEEIIQEGLTQQKQMMRDEGMACIAVSTPAIHQESGATTSFPYGCLPPGWESLR